MGGVQNFGRLVDEIGELAWLSGLSIADSMLRVQSASSKGISNYSQVLTFMQRWNVDVEFAEVLNSRPYTFAHLDSVEVLATPTGSSILDSMSRLLQELIEMKRRSDYDDCVVRAFEKELRFCA